MLDIEARFVYSLAMKNFRTPIGGIVGPSIFMGHLYTFRRSISVLWFRKGVSALIVFCLGNVGFAQADIEFWYGQHQSFGKLGNPQKQVNILGTIGNYLENPCVWYVLNDGPSQRTISLGSDLHRLAKEGDFNVEIDRSELRLGKNTVKVGVETIEGVRSEKTVFIDYNEGNSWPLPYEVDWSQVERIQDVVDVIDGEWDLTSEGLRTRSPYYDRAFTLGDASWSDYEVSTSVKFHNFTEPSEGPPTYKVAHVAIAVRWPGHDSDEFQPNRKWYPLGATAEFRLEKDYQNCRWRIFDGEIFYAEQGKAVRNPILPEVWYKMKHRVETLSETRTLYSVKFWLSEEAEPEEWDFQAIEISDTKELGSACILAHNTDVTFGNVVVNPVEPMKVD